MTSTTALFMPPYMRHVKPSAHAGILNTAPACFRCRPAEIPMPAHACSVSRGCHDRHRTECHSGSLFECLGRCVGGTVNGTRRTTTAYAPGGSCAVNRRLVTSTVRSFSAHDDQCPDGTIVCHCRRCCRC